MKEKSDKKNNISEWIIGDATKLPFKTNSIDYCIDKGTIDALMCGDDNTMGKQIMKEMVRVSKNGVFLITHGDAMKRRFLFTELS